MGDHASPHPPGSVPDELAQLLEATDPATQTRAWERLLDRHSRLILHAAKSTRSGSGYDAMMDRYTYVIEQLRADDFRRLRRFAGDGRGKFTTWLTVVARRLCLDYHRQRYGRSRGTTESSAAQEGQDLRRRLTDLVAAELDVEQIPSRPTTNPERTLERREVEEALAEALRALAAQDRLMLTLRYEDDLPAREIAELVGFPTAFHVYRRINKLLEQLRDSLKERGIQDAAS